MKNTGKSLAKFYFQFLDKKKGNTFFKNPKHDSQYQQKLSKPVVK